MSERHYDEAREHPELMEAGGDIDPTEEHEREHGDFPPTSHAIIGNENADAEGRNPRKFQYRRVIHAGKVSATPALTIELDYPREGFCWFIERVLIRSTGVGNLTIFDGDPGAGVENTLWFGALATANIPVTDTPPWAIYVPEQRKLFAVGGGGILANDVWIVRLQVREEEMIR